MVFKKEKAINRLILKHLARVDHCLKLASETVEEYLKGNVGAAKVLALKVDRCETETDNILREIMGNLYSGAYLPSLRSDIFHLVQYLDSVANAAEACCDFFLAQRPGIPDEMKSTFLTIMKESVSSCSPLKEAVNLFLKNNSVETIRAKAKEVGMIESAVDKGEWDLTRDIFKTDLDYGRKIHLKQCLESIVTISDRAEDASDQLQLIVIKGGL